MNYYILPVTACVFLVCSCADTHNGSNTETQAENSRTQIMSKKEQDAITALKWLDTANPAEDARHAIAEQRFVLYLAGGKGGDAAGIPETQQVEALQRCETQPLPGVTDTVYGNEHLRYLQRARDYAAQFNAIMSTACTAR